MTTAIVVAAAVVRNAHGEIYLLVRKRDTARFMLPGGKIDFRRDRVWRAGT